MSLRPFQSLLAPLLLRPLLWMCAAALGGVTLGGLCARAWAGLARENAPLVWLAPFLLMGLALAWAKRRHEWASRAGWALALATFFAGTTARRLLPPRGDVSRLTAAPAPRGEPLHPVAAKVVGVVADYPRSSRYATRFPLEVETLDGQGATGRVAVSLPFDASLDIGDRLELQTDLRPLARPRNPGERDAFWSDIIAGCWCESGPVLRLERVRPGAAFPFARRVQAVRRALLWRYEALFAGDEEALRTRPFPRQNAALLTAMVWGESGLTAPLPDQTRADFRAAGLSHLLVASGTQISLAVVGLLWLARLFRVRRAWLGVVVVPGVVAYALLAGLTPSIWRAGACGAFAVLGFARGRDMDGLSLLCAALLGLLVLDPALAWSLSLQFTFAAVWGLVVIAPRALRVIRRVNGGTVGQLAALSLGAQAATWPLSVLHFGTSSAAGIGANFLAIPLAGLLVFAGALALVLPIGGVLYRLTDAVGALASGAAHPFGALVEGVSLPASWALGCYALLALAVLPFADEWPELRAEAALWLSRKRAQIAAWHPKTVCALLAVGGAALTWSAFRPAPKTLRVTVLDVGQGQSIVVQDPSGHAALIDGGSLDGHERADVGASLLVPALQNLGISRLDAVFLTSPDDDHCNGLRRVLREIPVGQFVDGPRAAQTKKTDLLDALGQAQLQNVRREADRLGVPVVVPRAGELFPLGATSIRVLNPLLPLGASLNDNSLALRVEWHARAVVIGGELEAVGERRLVKRAAPLRADALVLARHGAGTSSSPEWLRACSPGAAIISCGRYNRLSDPAPSVLRALTERKIPLFRTDLDGALSVECEAQACRVTPTNP